MHIGKEFIVKGKPAVITNFIYCLGEISDVEFSYNGKIYLMNKDEFLKKVEVEKNDHAVITQNKSGYEVLTSDHRHYVLERTVKGFDVRKTNLNKPEQMTGTLVHGIPAEIKKIFYELQRK